MNPPAAPPFSPACERNRAPIAEALGEIAVAGERVLEIGAGTGQHAVYLAPRLGLDWQPTDLPAALPGIRAWIDAEDARGVRDPLVLDVVRGPWPAGPFDGAFSANTAHILAWAAVEALFEGVAGVLRPHGWFALYGPFNERGCFTSEGNARLDAWARSDFPGGGLRDRAEVQALAARCGFEVHEDRSLPANNRILVWRLA